MIMLRDHFLGYQVKCGWFFGIVQIACTFIDIILGICLSFMLFRIRKPCIVCMRLSWLLYFGSVASCFCCISSLGWVGNRGCFGMYLLATVFTVFWWFHFNGHTYFLMFSICCGSLVWPSYWDCINSSLVMCTILDLLLTLYPAYHPLRLITLSLITRTANWGLSSHSFLNKAFSITTTTTPSVGPTFAGFGEIQM